MDIKAAVNSLEDKLKKYRRDFHKYPEPGWLEFRTSSKIASVLMKLGYEVKVGHEVVKKEAAMGRPGDEVIAKNVERAVKEGADPEILKRMDGLTGVLGIMDTGRPGPTLAYRFDIDAVEVDEAREHNHRPYKEGFSSEHPGVMHACGHDGHAAVGLGLAEVLTRLKDELHGEVKLIFQPAEEGVRGARAMVQAGVVDDVDYFLALHIGFGKSGGIGIVTRSAGFFATSKLDVEYRGRASHAGAAPQEGKNALLAAATVALNLHAIAPHSDGATRVNVGALMAGTGRNVICDRAVIKLETRGATTALNDYVKKKALKIIEAGAAMYDLDYTIHEVGCAMSAEGDEELASMIKSIGRELGVEHIIDEGSMGGSEDATYFMEKVRSRGGKALYYQVITPIAADHHSSRFDFDERGLSLAVVLHAEMAKKLLNPSN
ncbi:MAG: aminobenzoyl-glutamate utilization protein [Tepidanaerobacteraceae bacterium]|nr:aminobenzoyl-glutamate utilization protein [Tepidanaerobacteraceae bacterium]